MLNYLALYLDQYFNDQYQLHSILSCLQAGMVEVFFPWILTAFGATYRVSLWWSYRGEEVLLPRPAPPSSASFTRLGIPVEHPQVS